MKWRGEATRHVLERGAVEFQGMLVWRLCMKIYPSEICKAFIFVCGQHENCQNKGEQIHVCIYTFGEQIHVCISNRTNTRVHQFIHQSANSISKLGWERICDKVRQTHNLNGQSVVIKNIYRQSH